MHATKMYFLIKKKKICSEVVKHDLTRKFLLWAALSIKQPNDEDKEQTTASGPNEKTVPYS